MRALVELSRRLRGYRCGPTYNIIVLAQAVRDLLKLTAVFFELVRFREGDYVAAELVA